MGEPGASRPSSSSARFHTVRPHTSSSSTLDWATNSFRTDTAAFNLSAGKQAMPTLLSLPGVLPNLLSSLRAALPAAGPSPAQSTTSQVDLKGLTTVLQSLANAVGAMHHFVSGGRWGSGLTEDDPTGGHNAESAEIRVEWRGAIARQVHGFLQVRHSLCC
jgi:hypothetical protein